MLKATAAALLGLSLMAQPAQAFTAAELMQSDKAYAYGYVHGVTDMRIGLVQSDPRFGAVRECVIKSGANIQTLYGVVEQYIRRNPKELSFPAFGTVMNALNDMCS